MLDYKHSLPRPAALGVSLGSTRTLVWQVIDQLSHLPNLRCQCFNIYFLCMNVHHVNIQELWMVVTYHVGAKN